ncbi:heme-binding domain-containing protein [Bacteriovoracaceae bacterium]|nr:heme-binding domain-containing protein [Bacteriovoracaceae bacterium]
MINIRLRCKTKILVVFIFCILPICVWSHGGEDHSKRLPTEGPKKPNDSREAIYKDINKEYLKTIKHIFKKSCFDCHSNQTTYPWYYKLPIIKGIIDSDILEAKKHLDFSDDFPFKSHEGPLKDLEAIKESIAKDVMPPFKYRVFHHKSKLTEKERKQISVWIEKSLKQFN